MTVEAARKVFGDFLAHFDELKKLTRSPADEDDDEEDAHDGFEDEFMRLKDYSGKFGTEGMYASVAGKFECNRKKNRYKDILPYDSTRVKLREIEGVLGSDYINASYIKGVAGSNEYIAAQAPLPPTLPDFWRMIMEQKVVVIVMVANEKEGNKVKCEKYWPDKGEEKRFGSISVSLISEDWHSDYFVERHLLAKCHRTPQKSSSLDGEPDASQAVSERCVVQYHYIAWPDHGIPSPNASIPHLIGLVRQRQQELRDPAIGDAYGNVCPLLVHCSAGCGRTGTVIAIDYVQQLLEIHGVKNFPVDFSLFDIAVNLRRQRTAMIQTKEQYVVVYRAVAELFRRALADLDSEGAVVGPTRAVEVPLAPKSSAAVAVSRAVPAAELDEMDDLIVSLNRSTAAAVVQKAVPTSSLSQGQASTACWAANASVFSWNDQSTGGSSNYLDSSVSPAELVGCKDPEPVIKPRRKSLRIQEGHLYPNAGARQAAKLPMDGNTYGDIVPASSKPALPETKRSPDSNKFTSSVLIVAGKPVLSESIAVSSQPLVAAIASETKGSAMAADSDLGTKSVTSASGLSSSEQPLPACIASNPPVGSISPSAIRWLKACDASVVAPPFATVEGAQRAPLWQKAPKVPLSSSPLLLPKVHRSHTLQPQHSHPPQHSRPRQPLPPPSPVGSASLSPTLMAEVAQEAVLLSRSSSHGLQQQLHRSPAMSTAANPVGEGIYVDLVPPATSSLKEVQSPTAQDGDTNAAAADTCLPPQLPVGSGKLQHPSTTRLPGGRPLPALPADEPIYSAVGVPTAAGGPPGAGASTASNRPAAAEYEYVDLYALNKWSLQHIARGCPAAGAPAASPYSLVGDDGSICDDENSPPVIPPKTAHAFEPYNDEPLQESARKDVMQQAPPKTKNQVLSSLRDFAYLNTKTKALFHLPKKASEADASSSSPGYLKEDVVYHGINISYPNVVSKPRGPKGMPLLWKQSSEESSPFPTGF